ncbi:division/outer membrane stress-associated lipid-binding lipoprotein [Ferrimonas lipolytica]|uniref:Divisome-associated lipoprotein YraP n=1 Tax=Ferrimonas lipolytica TaxID=2724191 RepID=A0A6H1UI65_9GAMM|nr:division/outer membrane stress-associated lipid-binding lipoprotein [Ferrimonas lipolytica]QIZ78518.1 divisome-associated lipoprotein YraP [Ferrimonas lipolytica]
MTRIILACLLVSQLAGCAGALLVGTVGTAVMVNDRRSMGSQIDDNTIEVEIMAALAKHEDLSNQTRISAVSMNQQVLLVGQVPNQMLHDKALKAIREINGIERLHDQLRTGNPLGFTSRSNDSWITTKVKSRMVSDDDLSAIRIKVVTENKEVFLLGVVSQAEAAAAVEVARNTDGVNKVVKVFEYQ